MNPPFSRLLFAFLVASVGYAQEPRPESPAIREAMRLEEQGKFIEATAVLGRALALQISSPFPEIRKELEFELERLDRIRKDYSLTRSDLYDALKRSVKDLTETEFETWITEGRFDTRVIDSVQYFMNASRSNLFFRYPELRNRRINPPSDAQFEASTLDAVKTITQAAQERGAPFVLPKTFRNTMTVTLKANTVPPGELVRAWLPVPTAFPHQLNIAVKATSSPVKFLAPMDSPIRSAYFEQRAERDKPTVFSVEYEYTAFGIRFDLQPLAVQPYDTSDATYKTFTAEGPHIVFTPLIRALSDSLAGSETNPLVKARTFYDWITENIQYSYALEYSTIRNISEYCLTKRYGDCGQAALLFITLCRFNGIPARWQSGWLTMPGGKTIHDWTEIFINPYGWIPVDPYMGVFAMQYFSGPGAERRMIRDFYFGGLDQYRMAANSNHSQALNPPKQSVRSDTVDFQRGELEYGQVNIYFDKYSYSLKVEEINR
ncbi:MAG: transglutaminase domain-containing protein [Ignavibacterium sp.]|jgi:transglutaminase-like putative cysteine protease